MHDVEHACDFAHTIRLAMPAVLCAHHPSSCCYLLVSHLIAVSVGSLDLMQQQTRYWEIAFVMNWQEACMGRQGTQEAISWQRGMAGARSGEL